MYIYTKGIRFPLARNFRMDFSVSVKNRSGLADTTCLDCEDPCPLSFDSEVMGDNRIFSFRNGVPAVFCKSTKDSCVKGFLLSVCADLHPPASFVGLTPALQLII